MKTLKKTIDRKKRHQRIRTKIRGTEECPRLVVFRSLNNHFVQLINDDKGLTLASASDYDSKTGKKADRAKEVGKKIAQIAIEKNIKCCVFDRNGYRYHGRVKALADGAREGGLKF